MANNAQVWKVDEVKEVAKAKPRSELLIIGDSHRC